MIFEFFKRSLLVVLGILVTVYMVRVLDSRNQIPLEPEHLIQLDRDYDVDRDGVINWQAYRSLERDLAEDLDQQLAERSRNTSRINRHHINNPLRQVEKNWNYSQLLEPQQVSGVAVLVHGLTDSPYSVRATAEIFQQQGYITYAPRLPGHGYNVGSLSSRDRRDWMAIVEMTIQEAIKNQQPGQPFILGGYSTGAALAIKYAMDCEAMQTPCPDKLLLISPALQITPFAVFAHIHKLVSWIPYLQQFQWNSLAPEIDLYKFSSFPKNPGWDSYQLSNELFSGMTESRLPPMLVFQSIVDATVSTPAVMRFMLNVQPNHHQVVFYDFNRYQVYTELFLTKFEAAAYFLAMAPTSLDITLISNTSASTQQVSAYQIFPEEPGFQKSPIGLSWPKAVYSLSHIALPFAPLDTAYGEVGTAISRARPLGERNVLSISPDYFQRLRYNPFFDYQASRIKSWLTNEVRNGS